MPGVYHRFAEVVGAKHWEHRVAQIKGAIKSNPFLADHLHAENTMAYALDRCGVLIARYGCLPVEAEDVRTLYPALSFAGQVLSLMDIASPVEADRLRKRVAATLKNPDAMRGFRLELAAATHFARRGHKLVWPEMVGGGTFDLLVTDLASSGLEVECKSTSGDKGRRIHRREALEFHHLLFTELASIRKSLRIGLAVVLTVPGRLPTRHTDRAALVKHIRQQINIGQSAMLDDGSDIRLTEFDVASLGKIANGSGSAVVRAAIERATATQNREGMLMSTSKGGAFAFVVQSAVNDDFLDATFDTLSDAAKQLSGTRPGILIAGFDGLDADQLISIAGQDHDPQQPPTGLACKASKFLSADHRDHVVGVGFLSRSALMPVSSDLVDSSGAAYYFPKRDSRFWHNDFSGLFSKQ